MYQRILVPIDGGETSTRGLDEALRLAQLTHGRARLVHVIDELKSRVAGTGWRACCWAATRADPSRRVASVPVLLVRTR